MTSIVSAFRYVFGIRRYAVIGIASFVLFFAVNLIVLSTPVADSGFADGFLSSITATVLLQSVFMAGLLGILAPFTIYLLRLRAGAHLGASSAGLLCSGVTCLLNPLCCGAISIVLGWIADLLPATAAYETSVFTFFDRYEALFFFGSVALLVYALSMNSRRIAAIGGQLGQ